ncbi:hypothetical protein Cgig2_009498 [Carnegiea gigantea]|uniref:Uncharacterized protein n=1 Tax=Carnegiea gigantea TaxID=171969 RepID=A0A9Q1JWT9_9CARY|nr:hypothetical protein Cgig2_009498 [Carnegiea gigantea]
MHLVTPSDRGTGRKHISNELKEYVHLHSPHKIALVETYISVDKADQGIWITQPAWRNETMEAWRCSGIIIDHCLLELESLRQSQIHFSLFDSKLHGRPMKGDQEIQKNWTADTSIMPTDLLQGIQTHMGNEANRYLLKLEQQSKKELSEFLCQTKTFWMQKLRLKAIWDRDCNTQYLHTSTVIRRRFNQIEVLWDLEGDWIANLTMLRSKGRDYFGDYSRRCKSRLEANYSLVAWGMFLQLILGQ